MPTQPTDPFETETCTRCGGCGEYSFNMMYGSTCFRCNGKGWTLTARGSEARRMFLTFVSKSVSKFKVGEWINEPVGMGAATAFFKIESIALSERKGMVDGVETETYVLALVRKDQRMTAHHYGHEVERFLPTTEYRDTMLAVAMEYQSKLGKNGKVIKKHLYTCEAPEPVYTVVGA